MIRVFRMSALCVSVLCWFASTGKPTPAADAQAASELQTAAAPADAKAKVARELTPAQSALRDRVRHTLAMHRRTPLNTRDNTPSEILPFCMAYGCSAEIAIDQPGGSPINGIAALCWSYPCGGLELLGLDRGRVFARVGYGHQERPGEFLAMLALSRVPPDYAIRVGKTMKTVADAVETEKLGCRVGGDASLKLVGWSFYVEEPEWKNDLGETWSIARLLDEEIDRPTASPEETLDRLLGLGYAVSRSGRSGALSQAPFSRASKYVADFQAFALKTQNSDGSWGPLFPAAGVGADPSSQLRATGRVLEWLALTLPENRLDDAQVIRAVECVNRLLGGGRFQWNAQATSLRDFDAMGRALHALVIYDQRVFQPADPPPAEAAEAASAAKTDGHAKR